MMREILGPLIDIQHVAGTGHVEPCPSSLSAFAAEHGIVLVNGVMVPYGVILGERRGGANACNTLLNLVRRRNPSAQSLSCADGLCIRLSS